MQAGRTNTYNGTFSQLYVLSLTCNDCVHVQDAGHPGLTTLVGWYSYLKVLPLQYGAGVMQTTVDKVYDPNLPLEYLEVK